MFFYCDTFTSLSFERNTTRSIVSVWLRSGKAANIVCSCYKTTTNWFCIHETPDVCQHAIGPPCVHPMFVYSCMNIFISSVPNDGFKIEQCTLTCVQTPWLWLIVVRDINLYVSRNRRSIRSVHPNFYGILCNPVRKYAEAVNFLTFESNTK